MTPAAIGRAIFAAIEAAHARGEAHVFVRLTEHGRLEVGVPAPGDVVYTIGTPRARAA